MREVGLMGTLLIRNADWIVTMDRDRRILRDGAVAIRDDRIVAVGKTAAVARELTADRIIEAAGKLVMPGLIDTHVHNTQQLGRGLADECDIAKHLLERLYGYERVVKTIDEAATLAEVQRRGEAIAAASGLSELIKPRWPVV